MQNTHTFEKMSNKKGKKDILKHAEVSERAFEMKDKKRDTTLQKSRGR